MKTGNTTLCLKMVGVAVCAGLLLYAAPAGATPIAVTNYSFETPDAGGGSVGFSLPTGWTGNPSRAGQRDKDYNDYFPNFSDGPGDGQQYEFAQSTYGNWPLTTTATVTAIESDLDYTLTVAFGNAGVNKYIPLAYTMELLANNVSVALLRIDDASDVIAAGTFQDFSVVLGADVIADQNLVGQGLKIRITSHMDSTHYLGQYDNVRLDATTPVPEPATAALLAMGGAGLLWRRVRRRRA